MSSRDVVAFSRKNYFDGICFLFCTTVSRLTLLEKWLFRCKKKLLVEVLAEDCWMLVEVLAELFVEVLAHQGDEGLDEPAS